ncbi:MAG TPA: hypothetical protein VFC93_10800 [Chloroflexota bacterium]|nr:hypothetical protein [Chloroflexota bacterium]
MNEQTTSTNYRIRVRGQLGETLLEAFPGLHAQAHGGETVLGGTLPDQAALHGVLAQIEGLGLELLEVRRVPPSRANGHRSPESGDDGSPDRR